MDTCPECGNHDLEFRVEDGITIRECGLCGERIGERRAVAAASDREEAAARGFAAEVWPLVRVLRQMPGLTVVAADAGSVSDDRLPRVTLAPTSADALVQIENLALSLQLGEGQLLCPWLLVVEYQRHLAFVLQPQGGALTDARLDLGTLRSHLERGMRLSWWRRPAVDT